MKTESVSGGGMYAGLESPVRDYVATMGRFDRADPLGVKGVVMGNPGSWNRFAYTSGDPVNYNDPTGLDPEKRQLDYCDVYWDDPHCHPFYSTGSIQGGGVTLTLQQQAYSYAQIVATFVKLGDIKNDCMGLAAFAASMASITSNVKDFIQAFGVFVNMKDQSVQYANNHGVNIMANSEPVIMLPRGQGPSGFLPLYQESLDPVNIDQVHHFSAFLQLGYQTFGAGMVVCGISSKSITDFTRSRSVISAESDQRFHGKAITVFT